MKMKPFADRTHRVAVPIAAAILLLVLPSIGDGQQWDCSSRQPERLPRELPSGRLHIERIGGHDRSGLPGSRVESRGGLELSQLSPADRQIIEELFNNSEEIKSPSGAADFESYCITRQTAAGLKTIQVPFNAAPAAVKKSVTTTFK